MACLFCSTLILSFLSTRIRRKVYGGAEYPVVGNLIFLYASVKLKKQPVSTDFHRTDGISTLVLLHSFINKCSFSINRFVCHFSILFIYKQLSVSFFLIEKLGYYYFSSLLAFFFLCVMFTDSVHLNWIQDRIRRNADKKSQIFFLVNGLKIHLILMLILSLLICHGLQDIKYLVLLPKQ